MTETTVQDLTSATELYIKDKDIITQVEYLESIEEFYTSRIKTLKTAIRRQARDNQFTAVIYNSKELERQLAYQAGYQAMLIARYPEAGAELDRQAGRVSA
tara:strand:- start:1282 stop:1584 length:303 start_codon:yes stop_codon:yes gene_type:complete